MLIIFGVRGYLRTLAMLTLVCRRCGNPAAHRLSQLTRKFTLFFVPLFPVAHTCTLTCAACGTTSKITPVEKDQLLAGVESAKYATEPQAVDAPPQAI